MTDEDRFREDFGALFRATYGELCSFVVGYVSSRAIAEELVQDLFLRMWERRASMQQEVPARSYLYHAARNRALDYLRHERIVHRTSSELAYEGERFSESADAELNAEDFNAALQVAIEQLPPGTRQVFVLCKGHGLKYTQIAETLDISVKTVEGQMSRAFRMLRLQLKDYLPVLLAAASLRGIA